MERKNLLFTDELILTVSFQFSAAHRYYNKLWSLKKNKKIFGACFSLYPHGHNYRLEVSIKNKYNEKTGMIINFNELEQIVLKEIIEKLDHKYLNEEVNYFKKKIPTTENIAIYVWKRLEKKLFPLNLHKIRIYEEENLYAECKK